MFNFQSEKKHYLQFGHVFYYIDRLELNNQNLECEKIIHFISGIVNFLLINIELLMSGVVSTPQRSQDIVTHTKKL